MPYKDKKKEQEYQKRVQKKYSFTVSKVNEKDMIDFLETHRPVYTYVKGLIRQDMNK